MDTDLTAFITARLDEDEAAAKGPPGWKLEHWTAVRYADKESGRNWRVDAEPRCVIDGAAEEDAQFIARYDPARVLREVAAKRAIRARVVAIPHDYVDGDPWYSCRQAVKPRRHDDSEPREPGSGCTRDDAGGPCDCGRDGLVSTLLGHQAAAWSDHPDYRAEWAP